MELFSLDNFLTLFSLIILQTVLGLDNLLYIALESQKAEIKEQKKVRTLGIGIAIILRIILLFFLIKLIHSFKDSLFTINTDFFIADFNIHGLIVLIGGAFILYTATHEIHHILNFNKDETIQESKSAKNIIISIILMNLIFSFDSILIAIALTDIFIIMAIAIIIGGVIMIYLSEKVAEFLQKNKMFEVLGLFILFIVGIMLLSEGAHISNIKIAGNLITPMSKTTFYFTIFTLIIIDIVQKKYQDKLTKK